MRVRNAKNERIGLIGFVYRAQTKHPCHFEERSDEKSAFLSPPAKSRFLVALAPRNDKLDGAVNVARHHGFALLCISTVLQVLSAAWHTFSSGHSAHFGDRAMQIFRPCQMI